MGADKAILVEVKGEDYEGLQPLAVSKIFAKLVEQEKADIAFFGKQVYFQIFHTAHLSC